MNYKGLKDKNYECLHCKSSFAFKGYSWWHVYCSLDCAHSHRILKHEEKKNVLYEKWLAGEVIDMTGQTLRRHVRNFLIRRDGYECASCGIAEWNNKPITLWVDHVDGDATNNLASNFRLVCPNCDSQSDTFGGKNRGRGLKSRGLSSYG